MRRRGRQPKCTKARRPRALPAVLLAALLGASGCQSGQATSGGAGLNDYEAGRYEQAYQAATGQIDNGGSDTARYVAGLSARRLGRNDAAVRHLKPLSGHSDPGLAGPANAALGLIATERGNHRKAIRYLRQAVKDLEGEDRAQAYYQLALAEQKLGRWASARTHLSMAISGTSDPKLRRLARQRKQAGGFTLQLGAFSEKSNAEELATSMRAAADEAGLNAPRVVPSRGDGGRLYLVRVGRFASEGSAERARRRLGAGDALVKPISDN